MIVKDKLKRPYLKEGALPVLFPNYPEHLMPTAFQRESPDSKRRRKEESLIKSAIEKNKLDAEEYKRQIRFENLQELSCKLKVDKYWSIIYKDQCVLISNISLSPFPKMNMSVIVNEDMSVQSYIENVAVKQLYGYFVPSHVHDTDTLKTLLCEMRKYDKHNISTMNPVAVIQLVLTFLSVITEQSFKHLMTLKFICEQLHLMTQKKISVFLGPFSIFILVIQFVT